MAAEFAWGRHDCVLAVCDHIKRETGIDPARPWRGAYGSAEEAAAVLAPFGGVLGIMRHGMAAAGFREGEPEDNSPVVVRVGGAEVAGIKRGRLVEMVGPRGRVLARVPVLAAWVI